MSFLRKNLVNVLLASGCTDRSEAETLASITPAEHTWTVEVLNSGKVDEWQFTREMGNLFSTPYRELTVGEIDRKSLSLLPSRFVFTHHIVPISQEGETVKLGTYDVFNSGSRRMAAQLLNRPVEWVLVPRTPLLRTIKSVYGVGAETFDEILKSSRALDEVVEEGVSMDISSDEAEASVVKFVNQIIREAIQERATDIHVEPLEQDLRIRYRIDGILHEVAVPPQLRLLQSAIISRLKVMAHMDIAERRLPQDGRINLQSGKANIDVRVSTIPTVNGESISLRLLTRSVHQFDFDVLDLSPGQEKLVRQFLQQPNGIILVTGPTGSGKSTSLYSFLTSINSVQRRIITIEEPVEYRLKGVSQIEVKPEINLTFANGLRSILRQDPNVIMVGEIRDFETAEIAIRSAMTGHLVFSTLHTNDAVGGITRLLDMGVEPFLLASVVRVFIAQRLVRTICQKCKIEAGYPIDYLIEIGAELPTDIRFYRGAGCDSCRQTGYQGRVAIFEICPISEGLRRLIIHRATGTELKQRAIRDGMITLRQDGWRRVLAGQTSVEEVVRVTQADELIAETD